MGSTISRRDLFRKAQGLALGTPFLSLLACGDGRRSTLLKGATMGTTYSVQLYPLPAGAGREDLKADIDRILETVNDQMSTYRPDSEISRLNRSASTAWLGASVDTVTVVEEALRIARLSAGAFDPTIGPLVDLWGFGAEAGQPRIPSPEAIEATLGRVGYRGVRTRLSPPAVGKDAADIRVDLSGIAKGFGVDKVAAYLERSGVQNYLVEIGGELRGRGYSRRGEAWRIGIEMPIGAPRTVARVVRLGGAALATSGDYRIFFESEGARFSHIINPRSGRPVEHGLASVTVVAPSALQADAWSTALMVLGPEAGLELARRENLAALFIARNGDGFTETRSPGFAQYLVA